MNKLYRRCKVFYHKELKGCPSIVAWYGLAYEFGLSDNMAKKMVVSFGEPA